MWDVASNHRVDHFICNSHNVEKRIKKIYRREAEVIYPPVDIKRFTVQRHEENYFLIVSSLVSYKRIDLAVEAFNRLGYPLKIIGSGREEKRLRSKAKSNVEFLGWLPDAAVAEPYSKCRPLIFPGGEDFGIVPLEAMASGRPVIAYGRGGALESIIAYDQQDGTEAGVPTGLFFYEPHSDALIDAIERFVRIEKEFDPLAIRNHTLKWDREIFKEKMKSSILEKFKSTG
jgi:glycosyltransferase involved in cell wall biosynthesis